MFEFAWRKDLEIPNRRTASVQTDESPSASVRLRLFANDCIWPKPGLATCERSTVKLTFGAAP